MQGPQHPGMQVGSPKMLSAAGGMGMHSQTSPPLPSQAQISGMITGQGPPQPQQPAIVQHHPVALPTNVQSVGSAQTNGSAQMIPGGGQQVAASQIQGPPTGPQGGAPGNGTAGAGPILNVGQQPFFSDFPATRNSTPVTIPSQTRLQAPTASRASLPLFLGNSRTFLGMGSYLDGEQEVLKQQQSRGFSSSSFLQPPDPAPPTTQHVNGPDAQNGVFPQDALSYLDQVKFQFQDYPDVYNKFLDIMKDFKSQA